MGTSALQARHTSHLKISLHSSCPGEIPRFVVAGIRMARDTDSRVIRQHAIQALGHFVRSVGDDDLARMQRIADAGTSAVMKRNPTCAGSGVEQRVENRPVGDRVDCRLSWLRFRDKVKRPSRNRDDRGR